MIDVTPFCNPFRQTTQVAADKNVKIVVKRGKVYKEIVRK